MTSPKRIFGLRGSLATAAIGLVILIPLGFFAPAMGALALAVIALLAAFLLQGRAAALAASQEKVSGEIDVLSRHLLKVETLAQAAATRAQAVAATPTQSGTVSETAALRTGLEDLTAEIGLLSGIVGELASVIAAQEAEIARLKSASIAPVATAPPPVVVSDRVADKRTEAPPATSAKTPFRPPVFGTAVETAEVPQPAGQARPLDAKREAAILAAFDGEGLEVWLQPVVTLPQRKVVSYEASARLRIDDAVIAPETFLPVLERHGRTTALDRRMLARVATIARHLQGRGSPAAVAYALSPMSLFEPDFLRSLGGLAGGGANLAGRVVLALPQASWRSLDPEQTAVLGALRGRLGFVLDRPTDLRFDAATLAALGIDQIKVPAAMLLRPPQAMLSDIATEDLVAALGRSGLKLVAAQVERESNVPDLIDLDIPFAQGAVFAASRAVRPEVLVTPEAPPVAEAPREPEPAQPPQKRAFRDFLRRAV